ncbi:MAG: hypothetical protein J5797_08175 [Prevotella sp.]|nr:hypothetical protein [Prevotella sp.]
MRRHLLLLTVLTGLLTTVQAQNDSITLATSALEGRIIDPTPGYVKPFSHLDVSLTTGSTGLGFDVSMPINDLISVRAGYAFMPHASYLMHFGVEVGEDPQESQRKFNKLAGLLESLTGNQVDNVVAVEGRPTYWNWKLLADVKPFRDKRWHLTAGFYLGSHEIAKAVNAIEDMPSLMAVGIYNSMYFRALNGEPMLVVGETELYHPELQQKLLDYGKMSILMGEYTHDIPYKEDVVSTQGMFIDDVYYPAGSVLHKANDPNDPQYRAGDYYRAVPDENSMVKAWAYANRFKPYLGFGYGGRLLKNDDSWQVSFDCGAMFWGGVPKVITHDGTDLVNDVKNVPGLVGDYVDIVKNFKVFPVLNLRITKRIF